MRPAPSILLLALAASSPVLGQVPVARPPASEVHVTEDKAFLYESPDAESAVLRRLFRGEILIVTGELASADEVRWLRVQLGPAGLGYVRADKVGNPGEHPVERWKPAFVLRDERPLGVATRLGGEVPGLALQVRYQPFSRLGLSADIGFTEGYLSTGFPSQFGVKGPHLGLAVFSCPVLHNLSPLIELGISSDSFSDGLSTLQLYNVHGAAGVEWMFDWGGFAQLALTYVHSIGEQVIFSYANARQGKLETGSFELLHLKDSGAYEQLRVGLTLGYAF